MLALMTSMAAMAVDSMLPALATMGSELGASSSNTPQLIISASMFGLAAGQILYGPLSDSWGRRRGVFLGIGIFLCGTLLCIFARDFNTLMVGRVLQGVGAAGPRVICTSIVRDLYVGRSMARIISIIMGIFIMVPALAPTLGQFILVMAGWRMIFVVLLAQAVIALAWYGLRQAETLKREFRRSLSAGIIWEGFVEVATNRISFWYTVAAGCTFGGFVG